jgi:hypothetical protein
MMMDNLSNRHFTPLQLRNLGGKAGFLTAYIEQAKEHVFRRTGMGEPEISLLLRKFVSPSHVTQRLHAATLDRDLRLPAGCAKQVLDTLEETYITKKVQAEGSSSIEYVLLHDHVVQVLDSVPDKTLQEAQDAEKRLNFWIERIQVNESLHPPSAFVRLISQPMPLGETLRLWGFVSTDIGRKLVQRSLRGFLFRSACVLMLATVVGWFLHREYSHVLNREYLATSKLPKELYDWQHQLTSLTIEKDLNLDRFRWLSSKRLCELSLASRSAGSISGLSALRRCGELKSLVLDFGYNNELSDLSPIQDLSQVKSLDLNVKYTKVNNLTPLAQLTQLEILKINLEGTSVQSSELTHLTKLSRLNNLTLRLDSSDVDSLPGLEVLDKLESLTLGLRGLEIADVSVVGRIHTLTELTLDLRDTKTEDLSGLATLLSLRTLNLALDARHVPKLSTVEIPSLVHLSLELARSGQTTDPMNVKVLQLPRIREADGVKSLWLNLADTDITDLSQIEAFNALTELKLILGETTSPNLLCLRQLPELRILELEMGRLVDLSFLEFLPKLETLKIVAAKHCVVDWKPLHALKNLHALSVEVKDDEVDLAKVAADGQLCDLREFDMSGKMSNAKSIKNLAGLRVLRLDMQNNAQLELGFVEAMGQLRSVTLLCRSEPVNLDPLGGLGKMCRLDLTLEYCEAVDLAFLKNLQQLSDLTVFAPGTSCEGLSSFVPMSLLESLSVRLDGVLPIKSIPSGLERLTFKVR